MAGYPKPLLQKTLEKRYQKFNPETREFLRKFFTASAKLYGAVFLDDLHEIYKNLVQERQAKGLDEKAYVEGITWDEFVDFSSVARRDGDVNFYVYELQELFSDETNSMGDRMVILKELVGRGYYKFGDLYNLLDNQGDKDFFIPTKFLDYAQDVMTPAGKKLLKFINGLKSTASKVSMLFDDIDKGAVINNKFRGSYLKNIHSILRRDEILVNNLDESEIAISDKRRIFNIDGTYRSFAEQMFSMIVDSEQTAYYRPADELRFYVGELNRMGVELNGKQMNEFVQLVSEYHNTIRLRVNRGYTALELRQESPNLVPKFVFGNGYKEMIKNGDMNLNELRDSVFNDDKMPLPMKKSILDGLKDLENKI